MQTIVPVSPTFNSFPFLFRNRRRSVDNVEGGAEEEPRGRKGKQEGDRYVRQVELNAFGVMAGSIGQPDPTSRG